jgi:hypothetical protein
VSPALQGDTLPRHELPGRGGAARDADPLTEVPGFGPAPLATLVWDDGTRHVLRAPTVLGRNPGAVPGWHAVAIRDETLSLSRTHVAIGGRPGAVWVADTGSMNGIQIVRRVAQGDAGERDAGEGAAEDRTERHRIAPGERWIVRTGDILEFGDRRASIEGV